VVLTTGPVASAENLPPEPSQGGRPRYLHGETIRAISFGAGPGLACGTEHEVEFISLAEFRWCDHECREIFVEAVQKLIGGCSLEQFGIDPDSRLAQEGHQRSVGVSSERSDTCA
jgi:hypothetical protein